MTFIKAQDKTFAELQADAATKWQQVLDQRAAQFKAQADALATMPDVLARPDATQHWTPDPINIVCPCGGLDFFVTRWVTINGVKHRWEGTCASCNQVRTWDWLDMVWI
jgi:hypothetical protein